MNIYTQNLPVCNSGQHTYVLGLFNFFFALQYLIDRMTESILILENSFSEELASHGLVTLYVTSFF